MANDVFKINKPRFVHETFDDEIVLVDFESGNYFSLGKVGIEIVELIGKGKPKSMIIQELTARFDAQPDRIKREVDAYVKKLANEKIIVPDLRKSKSPASSQTKPPFFKKKQKFESPVLEKYTDMKELLMLDPIHEVDDTGWPSRKKAK